MTKAKRVKRYVAVYDPETGATEVLQPGMRVPDYATDQVTNPKVFEDDPTAEAPVNEGLVPSVDEATQRGVTDDGSGAAPAEPVDPGPVSETPNANPAQRQTAGEPGANQAPEDGGLAPADDPENPASGVGGVETPPEGEGAAPAKKTAAKKTAAKRAPAKKTAAKKTAASS
jgi:ribonuclease E